jgi:hypothetical protein
MDLLTQDDMRSLVGRKDTSCVTIYLPTHPVGEDIQQDPIRFKNLLRKAEGLLEAEGMKKSALEKVLSPGRTLLKDTYFWQCQSDGLAVFATDGFFRYFRLPVSFEELAVVSERFHIKPLIPLLSESGRFYVLALSQNEIRLLQGSAHTVTEVQLEDVPTSLGEALKYDHPEKQLQYHTGTPSHGGKRPAVFHGQGVGTDDAKHKVEIKRYFDLVDKGIYEILSDQHDPLVLVGVEYLLPIYREANSYPHLLEEGVTGNPEHLSAKELHEKTWKVVEPVFTEGRRKAQEVYQGLAGTGRTSDDIEEVVPAAYQGRVDTLFVTLDAHRWGRFDTKKADLELHDQQQPGDEDVLDLAAIHSLINKGKVYVVKADQMPDGEPLAAVFRY